MIRDYGTGEASWRKELGIHLLLDDCDFAINNSVKYDPQFADIIASMDVSGMSALSIRTWLQALQRHDGFKVTGVTIIRDKVSSNEVCFVRYTRKDNNNIDDHRLAYNLNAGSGIFLSAVKDVFTAVSTREEAAQTSLESELFSGFDSILYGRDFE